MSDFTLAYVKHRFRLAPEECRNTLFVCFASPTTMSASRCWSFCACLSTFVSKYKVDTLCNQSRSAWWSIKEKKQETTTNQKTTTKQVDLDTTSGTFYFIVFALECVALPPPPPPPPHPVFFFFFFFKSMIYAMKLSRKLLQVPSGPRRSFLLLFFLFFFSSSFSLFYIYIYKIRVRFCC